MASSYRLMAVWLSVIAGTAGCRGPEGVAREFLESGGLHDIALERADHDSSFRYTARYGSSTCSGRVDVVQTRNSTRVNDAVSCRPHEETCTERRKSNACFRLGLIHDDGDTDPLSPLVADRTRAAAFYAIGCEEGHARACNALGLKHVEGDGVVTDLPRAAQLFERSCAGNHPKGCFNLALSYEQGRGVPADLPRATTLYDRACRRGLESACEGHRRLARVD